LIIGEKSAHTIDNSTFEFFLVLFNVYFFYILSVGLVLLAVMIGLVKTLVSVYKKQLEAYINYKV